MYLQEHTWTCVINTCVWDTLNTDTNINVISPEPHAVRHEARQGAQEEKLAWDTGTRGKRRMTAEFGAP